VIIDVLPQSPSVLLRAMHVVRLVLTAVQPGPWEKVAETMSRRNVELSVRVEEVFKGKGPQKLVIRIVQHRNDAFVYQPVPGAWSEQPIEKGLTVVVAGSGASLEAALVEPLQVLPARSAEEVRLVATAEEKRLPVQEVTQQATAIAAALDYVFAQWLWERFGERALVDPAAAEAVFSLLEVPALEDSARVTLIVDAVGRAGSAQSTYLAGTRRLTRALFRLLPDAKTIADNLVTVDLPALLRLRSLPPVPRSMVLDDKERDAAKKSLAAYSGKADVQPLEAWLAGP